MVEVGFDRTRTTGEQHAMTAHRAPDEITAREIIAAISDVAPDARVEQTGGNVATIFYHGDTLAIGPGRFDWSDPLASTFRVNLDLFIGRADGEGGQYLAHDASDAMIRNAVAQSIADEQETPKQGVWADER